jgi:polysaccharide chain length determinant protein (PEP-CTERM system associated)
MSELDNFDNSPSRTLQDYLQIARRRKWWLVLPLFLAWALVMVAAWFIPPQYRSETVIIVEQQRIPEQYVVPNVAIDLQQRLQSMTQQILSRTRLLGIIDGFHLYKKDQKTSDADPLVERMRKDIKIDLVQAPGRPWELSAFKISYSAGSPQLAQQVTQKLSSLFIEENLRNRQQLSEDTTKFLENQLEDARKNLAAQEERLRDFKTRYLGELPEQLQTNIQILSGLQARLQAATEALDQANQQKLYLESLLNQYKTLRTQLAVGRSDSALSPVSLDDQLEKLKTQLADLSSRDTPKHPDIVRLKKQIADAENLKQQMDSELKSAKSDGTDSVGRPRNLSDLQAMSPMLQIDGQIKSNQLEIANRKQEIRRLEAQIDAYQAHLDLTPVREQQLAAITRDHEQSRTNYESLLNKKMQSEMATNLEKRQEGEQFRIIDPPNFPQKPYSPNRLKFSLLGLIAGIVLSLGLTTLIEMTDERVNSEEDLLSVTPLPMLTAIPLLQTPAEQERRAWHFRLQMTAAALLITAIPAITALVYYRG